MLMSRQNYKMGVWCVCVVCVCMFVLRVCVCARVCACVRLCLFTVVFPGTIAVACHGSDVRLCRVNIFIIGGKKDVVWHMQNTYT